MGMQVLPAQFANIPDRTIDLEDAAYEKMMRSGSAALREAVRRELGWLWPCGHLNRSSNRHVIGGVAQCKECRRIRWRQGFNKAVAAEQLRRAVIERMEYVRSKRQGKPWPEWYNPEGPFDLAVLLDGIASDFNMTAGELLGAGRKGYQVDARRVAATILRNRGWSYPQIGRALGGRDHSTVINLTKNFDYYLKNRPEIRRSYIRRNGKTVHG